MLTPEQETALAAMIEYLQSPPEAPFCLQGFAGTGKSFTISKLLSQLDENRTVAFTAPTNKAAKVLRSMGVGFAQTTHSLFNLTLKKQAGKEILVQTKVPDLSSLDIIIIDECSMVNSELYSYIEAYFDLIHIIFIGDPAQLPPVNEHHSKTFDTKQVVTLTTPMRQQANKPLIKLCTRIRNCIESPSMIYLSPSSEVVPLEFEDWANKFMEYFSDPEFTADPDFVRVIAYRNDNVRDLNTFVHSQLYPDCDLPFAVGEPVVFSSAVSVRADANWQIGKAYAETKSSLPILASTETEGKLTNLSGPFSWGDLSYYVAEVSPAYKIRIIDQTCSAIYAHRLEELARFKKWRDFFALQECFADMRHAYAMTAHKSQGSSFQHVFVDVYDILNSFNKIESKKCLYVACTRASKMLFLNKQILFGD